MWAVARKERRQGAGLREGTGKYQYVLTLRFLLKEANDEILRSSSVSLFHIERCSIAEASTANSGGSCRLLKQAFVLQMKAMTRSIRNEKMTFSWFAVFSAK